MHLIGEGTGTITLSGETYRRVVYDIAKSLVYHGFNKVVFVTHHGSNSKVVDEILRKIRYESGAFTCWYKTPTEREYNALKGIIEGPPEEWSYFSDRGPDMGFLGAIRQLTPAQASKPLGPSGTSIAAHLHHVAFCFSASAGWIRGERPNIDWDESWKVKTVTDAEWAALQARLRKGAEELDQAIADHALDGEEAYGGAVGAVAHAAYHLAVVRQKVGQLK